MEDIIIKSGRIEIRLRKMEYKWNSDRRDRSQFLKRQTNVYVHVKNEDITDDLKNRRCRPYTQWKKNLMPLAAKLIEEETGLIMGRKISWNQKLGCSFCPCSPGFKTSLYDEEGKQDAWTVWITV